MRDLHSVTAFCSKKVWSLLLFHTQAFLVSQQALTDGRWVSWLAAGAEAAREPCALRSPAGIPGAG